MATHTRLSWKDKALDLQRELGEEKKKVFALDVARAEITRLKDECERLKVSHLFETQGLRRDLGQGNSFRAMLSGTIDSLTEEKNSMGIALDDERAKVCGLEVELGKAREKQAETDARLAESRSSIINLASSLGGSGRIGPVSVDQISGAVAEMERLLAMTGQFESWLSEKEKPQTGSRT
jgi:chromosome segregation ATPase